MGEARRAARRGKLLNKGEDEGRGWEPPGEALLMFVFRAQHTTQHSSSNARGGQGR